jgi:hypothetical protein
MSLGRYTFSKRIDNNKGYSAADTYRIYKACDNGQIAYTTMVLEQSQRLDHLAGIVYENSTLWWVIAAASGIGWGLQVPPGTVIRIPSQPGEAIGRLL